MLMVAAGLQTGCRDAGPRTVTFDPPYPEHAGDGGSIVAVFAGRVPCTLPHCDRLKVLLVVYGSSSVAESGSYWLALIGAWGNDRHVTQGRWTTQQGVPDYAQAKVYALDERAPEGFRYFWRVDADVALVLDDHLRPRVGDGAWGFMLSRDDAPYGPRTYMLP